MVVWILSHYKSDVYENSRLLQEFKSENIDATLMHPDDFDIIVNKNSEKSIKYQGSNISLPKIVLTRTGSGTNYFSAAVIRQIEKFGIQTINNLESIMTVADKLMAHQTMSQHKIPSPKTMLVKFPVDANLVKKELGFPCVVKVLQGSYGKGVYLCENSKHFENVMQLINDLSVKKTLIVQEFIDELPGKDLRVWVIGGKVIGGMKRSGPEGDFRANITNGGTGEIFKITKEVEELAIQTATALGLNIAGIDLLFDKHGFKVCEANSAPGFEGFEKYCNVNIAAEIVKYIKNKI